MNSKQEVIHSMCITFRPDYENMPKNEAKYLYILMERLYNEDLEPFLKKKLNRTNLFGETNAPRRRKRKTKS